MKIKIKCFLQKDKQNNLWLTCNPINKNVSNLYEIIDNDIICEETINVNFKNANIKTITK